MSIVEQNLERLNCRQDTEHFFTTANSAAHAGLEVETHFGNLDANFGRAITPQQFYDINNTVVEHGDQLAVEAAANLGEVKNDDLMSARKSPELAAQELQSKLTSIYAAAKSNGIGPLPGSIIPFDDFRQLAQTHVHKGPNPRPTRFINYFMEKAPERAQNFITIGGMQSSATQTSLEERLRYFNQLANLTGILAPIFSTVPPFAVDDTGEYRAIKSNLSLNRRIQTAGGIQNAFPALSRITKINAEQSRVFSAYWHDQVRDNTGLFCYYDPDEEDSYKRLKYFDQKVQIPFSSLPEHLQTAENFEMAWSIQYGLATLSRIPASEKEAAQSRVEARFIDTGPQLLIDSLASLTHALNFNGQFQEAINNFVSRHGFNPEKPQESTNLLHSTVEKIAIRDFTDWSDLPYGDSSLRGAAIDFHKNVLGRFLDEYPGLQAIDTICAKQSSISMDWRRASNGEPERFRSIAKEYAQNPQAFTLDTI